MENVLAAFITFFLFLFSALTISSTVLSSEAVTRNAWQSMQARAETKARTHVSPVGALSIKALSTDPLTTFDVSYRNDGEVKLFDFADWDVFVEYTDTSNPAGNHINRLPMDNTGTLIDSRWTVEGIYRIYLNTPVQNHVAEVIEPGIVNPGEVLAIRLTLTPPAQSGKPIQVTLSTPNGVTATTQFTPDAAPVLAVNAGLTAASAGSTPIDKMHLSATDADDAPGSVVYTVTMPPRQGDLSLGSTFTQFAIDNDLLQYNHTGEGPDGFTFTVSDGKTIIGPITFTIGISNPPVLEKNQGIVAGDQQVAILDVSCLNTTDPDNPPTELIYTIQRLPTHGVLNLGKSFTQAALNSGVLTYTRSSAGDDSFVFTVTDGQTTIGPYTFTISQS